AAAPKRAPCAPRRRAARPRRSRGSRNPPSTKPSSPRLYHWIASQGPEIGRPAALLILDLRDAAAHREGPGSPLRSPRPDDRNPVRIVPRRLTKRLTETPTAIASALRWIESGIRRTSHESRNA